MSTTHKEQPPRLETPLAKAGSESAAMENPLLSNAALQQMHLAMLQCLAVGEHLASSGLAKPNVQGMEAALAGLAVGLLPTDLICPSQLELHVRIARPANQGPALADLLAGLSTTHSTGAGRRSAVAGKQRPGESRKTPKYSRTEPALSIAAEWNVANGMALAQLLAGNSGIAVVFSNCGVADLGGLKEALAFAVGRKLPIVYALWNGGGVGVSKARSGLRYATVRSTAEACGVPVIAVDGRDAVAVCRVAQECALRARNGGGPALIECGGARTGSGAAARSGHRSKPGSGTRAGKQSCAAPIDKMESYLARKGLFSPALRRQHVAAIGKELKAAARRLRSRQPGNA